MGILDGRVAIVTGGSSGIGRSSARLLAKEGAAVVVAARRTERLKSLVDEIKASGGKALAVPCDLGKLEDLDNLVKRTIEEFGSVDILANIGQGNMDDLRPLLDVDAENAIEFYKGGPLYSMILMQKCFPYMKEKGRGNIINTCSHTAVMGMPGYSSYAMAKEAIRALTRCAAMEWAQYGIVTNAFLPICKTEVADMDPMVAKTFEEIAKQSPSGYVGGSDDIAPVVLYLASDYARYINGQFIGADGGWRIFS